MTRYRPAHARGVSTPDAASVSVVRWWRHWSVSMVFGVALLVSAALIYLDDTGGRAAPVNAGTVPPVSYGEVAGTPTETSPAVRLTPVFIDTAPPPGAKKRRHHK